MITVDGIAWTLEALISAYSLQRHEDGRPHIGKEPVLYLAGDQLKSAPADAVPWHEVEWWRPEDFIAGAKCASCGRYAPEGSLIDVAAFNEEGERLWCEPCVDHADFEEADGSDEDGAE